LEKTSTGRRERRYLTSFGSTLDPHFLRAASWCPFATKALRYSAVLESYLILASGLPLAFIFNKTARNQDC
jgi:hypothetical protein